jgi:hypothetical protein
MLKTTGKILDKDSLLIFDCWSNTEENKRRILKMQYNYLTLVPKNYEIYKSGIKTYKESQKEVIYVNGIKYKCVKIKEGKKVFYVFHSKNVYKECLQKIKEKQE